MRKESKILAAKQQGIWGWIIFIILFAAFPFFATSEYQVKLANKILTFSLFAVSFNLLYGYTGMLSFGQAAFYGLGGYTVGMLMTKTTGCPFLLSVAACHVHGRRGRADSWSSLHPDDRSLFYHADPRLCRTPVGRRFQVV